MNKLTYILLFISSCLFGQSEPQTLEIQVPAIKIIGEGILSPADADSSDIIETRAISNKLEFGYAESLQADLEPDKIDTIEAVLLESDTTGLRFGYGRGITNHYLGFVMIGQKYDMVPCPDFKEGVLRTCLAIHYGYRQTGILGYLDADKKPLSKNIIVWDFKIIE